MRAIATLLSVVGYLWCAMAGIYVGYTAAVQVAPLRLLPTLGFLILLMVPGLVAVTVSFYLQIKSKRKT